MRRILILRSLTKNAIYNLIYTLINILFPFLCSIYISRVLNPEGIGKIAFAQNIVAYFVAFSSLGLPTYGVREIAKIKNNQAKMNSLFAELIIINTISTTIGLFLLTCLVVYNDSLRTETNLFIACGITLFFNFFNIDWFYQGLEEYGYITLRNAIVKIFSFIMILIFVNNVGDYVKFAAIISLGVGGNCIFNIYNCKKFIKPTIKEVNLKKHVKPLITIFFVIFLASIYTKIDTTMLGFFSTNDSVAFYFYAQKTINIVITITAAVTAALLPRLSLLYECDKIEFNNLLNKGFQVLCLTTLPFGIGLFLVSPYAINMLYGEAFEAASITTKLFCPLIFIKAFGDLFCYQLIYSTGHERVLLPVSALAAVLNIVFNIYFIPLYQHNGAVIASVITELTTNFIQFIYIKNKVKYSVDFSTIKVPLISTFFLAILISFIDSYTFNSNIKLLLDITLGVIVYVYVNIKLKNFIAIMLYNKLVKIFQKYN